MIKWLVRHQLLQSVLGVLLGLVLFGRSSAEGLFGILVFFAVLSVIRLAAEWFTKPHSLAYWEIRQQEWTAGFAALAPEAREAVADGLSLDPEASVEEVVRARLRKEIAAHPPLRHKVEIGAELAGVFGYLILLPPVIALYANDFYSPRMRHGWAGAAVVVLASALYLWPRVWKKPPLLSARRILWWTVPLFPLLLAFAMALELEHPYLNPLRDDRVKLAADRVLALRDNILAGAYVDWVMNYARALDGRGDGAQAARYYRAALRLNPSDEEAEARLAALEPGSATPGIVLTPRPSPTAPFWSAGQRLASAPRTKLDASLAEVERCTVVLVPVGAVPDHLLDAVAFTIEQELQLPVKVCSTAVPLPPHTRVLGLLTDAQWDVTSIAQALVAANSPWPQGPVRYVVLTPADIYLNDSNFAFSGSYEWGAVVSFARFGAPFPGSLCEHRIAKQSLGALLKGFGLPPSLDRDCVTSYTRSLDEFDRKGNRPNAATLAEFQRNLAGLNESWRRVRAARQR